MTTIEPLSEKTLPDPSKNSSALVAEKFTPVQHQCDALESFRRLAEMPATMTDVKEQISSASAVEALGNAFLSELTQPTHIPIDPERIDRLSQTLWSLCRWIEKLQDEQPKSEAETEQQLLRLSRMAQAAYDEVHQVLVKLGD